MLAFRLLSDQQERLKSDERNDAGFDDECDEQESRFGASLFLATVLG